MESATKFHQVSSLKEGAESSVPDKKQLSRHGAYG